MGPNCEIEIDVPFNHVDMLHIVWHGHYYQYFEMARTALFRKYDFDIPRIRELGIYMVVVESRCRYLSPIHYGMTVQAGASVSELEYRMKIDYLLRDRDTGRELAKGSTVHVTVNHETKELYMATPQAILDIFQWKATNPARNDEGSGT